MAVLRFRHVLYGAVFLGAGCSSSGSSLAPVVSATATATARASTAPASPAPSTAASVSPVPSGAASPSPVPSSAASATAVPSATPSAIPTATPSPTPIGSLSRAVVRGEAQTDLSLLRPYVFGSSRTSNLGVGNTVSFGAKRASNAAHRFAAAATCSNGETSTSSTSGGVTTVSVQIFYDAQCQVLWQSFTGTQTSTQGSSYYTTTSQGTDTIFAANGQQLEVDRLTSENGYSGSGAGGSFFVNAGPDASTTRESFGASCSGASQGGSCNAGDLHILATADALPAIGITESSTAPTSVAPVSATGTVQYAAGTPSATSIQSMAPFAISGASYTHSVTETSRTTTQLDATGLGGNAVQADDTAYDARGIATQTGMAITGSVIELSTNQTVAKYTLDINGYGSIVYPDGSMGTVAAFAIQN